MKGIYKILLRKWINQRHTGKHNFFSNFLIIEYPIESGIRYIAKDCNSNYDTRFDIVEPSLVGPGVLSSIIINLNNIKNEDIFKVANSKYSSMRIPDSKKSQDLIFDVCLAPLAKLRLKIKMVLIKPSYQNILRIIFKNEPTSFTAEDIFELLYQSTDIIDFIQRHKIVDKIDTRLNAMSADGILKSVGIKNVPLRGKVNKFNISSYSEWNAHLDRGKSHRLNKLMIYLTAILALTAAFQGNILHTEKSVDFFCKDRIICIKNNI